LRLGAQILALAGLYALVGRLGLAVAPVHFFASLVWAPTGVSLAVLLRGGLRYWPGVALGAFLVNAWTGAPVPVAVGLGAGNTLEAVVGAHLIGRAAGQAWSFDRLRGVLAFIVLGALVSTTLSASIGVSSLFAAGLVPRADVAVTWRVWWLGDAVGNLVVASLLLAWTSPRTPAPRDRRRTEAAALGAVLIAATLFVFFSPPVTARTGFLQACMLIPLLMWGAVRFEMRGATAAIFLASSIAVAGTASGLGPFVHESVSASLLHQQAFMAIVAVAVLIVGAVTAERGEALRRCETGEKALRERENELRLVTGGTPLMLTRCSRDLRYRFVNRAYARMLGRTPDQLAGRSIVEIIGAQGYETIRPHVEAVLRGRIVEYEDDVHLEGVGSRSLHVVYVPEQDGRGDVVGWLASITDVTDRARAEAEARSLAQFPEQNPNPVLRALRDGSVVYANAPARELLDEMGSRDGTLPRVLLDVVQGIPAKSTIRDLEVPSGRGGVYVFTLSRGAAEEHVNLFGLDITERKRAEESLREANLRKNEFLGVLSHELRNPLAPIQNSLHILEHAPEGSEQAARARAVIARQTHHLTRLVDDLLDVTRISRGVIQLHRAPVELGALARHAVEDHRPLFSSRSLALDLRTDSDPLWIDADATRVTQIIGNLLHNAAKFTNAQGHVSVDVALEAGRAVIRVTDDGVGIAPELLPHVFEPFTQAEATLHRTLGGLGLGLALVKGLVELHGGEVTAKSDGAGRGSEVTVRLPVLGTVGPAPEDPAARVTPSRRRVLVIEDNVDAAESLKESLELSGHEVAVARDGNEGLARARSFRPEVVLCDIGLPGIDGYEVARRIRADSSLSPLLVAVSGYALPEDQRKAHEAGFDRHLSKPFQFREVDEVLATVRPVTLSRMR
jgi:PAS domain S-box-containing protein